jgi:hypothetical protein
LYWKVAKAAKVDIPCSYQGGQRCVGQGGQYVKDNFPEVREIFFDDDTLTDDHDRVEELAKALGTMGITWSCNAKANVPRKTLEVLKANGLRLLLVGYESGNQKILHNIKKGLLVEVAKRFSKDCHDLGIIVHGTFILGLPGETRETIQETLAFAKEVNPRTLQVSLAAPYPGTFLYKQAKEMAGSRRMSTCSPTTARRSRRLTIRISAIPRSSSRWRSSTRNSISAPPRSPRSWARC